jgi:hypothetical protein
MNASSVRIQVVGLTWVLTWNEDNDTVTFTPSGNLEYATEYAVYVSGNDLAGNPPINGSSRPQICDLLVGRFSMRTANQ